MIRRYALCFGLFLLLGFAIAPALPLAGAAPGQLTFAKYHTPGEVNSLLQSWHKQYPKLVTLQALGKSYGGKTIYMLRIAATSKNGVKPGERPAVLVTANLEGNHLLGTEAALMLVNKILTGYGKDKEITAFLESRDLYAAPLLNPDTAAYFFSKPLVERKTNNQPVDEDNDGLIDEDGPEDLDKNGYITMMRVKDPEGTYILDPGDPRLMRKADPQKGEKGMYKLYVEGIDNDGDGQYNEDPPGGVELNRNFPHDFEYSNKVTGMWPVSQVETIALAEFMIAHPNIAMVLNFSTENTVLNQEQTGKAKAGGAKVKIPKMIAPLLGLDAKKEYTLPQVVEHIKSLGIAPPGMEITEELVASFLGLGPAMSIDRKDAPYLETIKKEYKDALKEAKSTYPQDKANGVGKGSFAAYCYYQLGVQVFCLDGWTVPKPKKKETAGALNAEKLKTMSNEDFIALGEEKIDAFLREQGAPENVKAAMLIKAVESGKITPAKMAEMLEKMPKKEGGKDEEHPDAYILQWSDTALGGKGFIPWKALRHPTLGEVEIGGFIPYLKTDPPAAEIEKSISFPVDFYVQLLQRTAALEIKKTRVEALHSNLYRVTLYLANNGWFPTSTSQGRRAGTAWPIRIELKTAPGQSLFSGKKIDTGKILEGSGDTQKFEWLIRGTKGGKVTITAGAPKCGWVKKVVTLQ